MESIISFWLSTSLVLLISVACSFCDAVDQDRQIYIVYMGGNRDGDYSTSSHHMNLLQQVVSPRFASQSLVRSYTRSFNAFAAYLSEEERQKLESFDGVVSVFLSKILRPQTTRSWDFMGFPQTVRRKISVESNVIVGVIDTGVWPESESFSDEGLGPVPSKWKGVCKGGRNFTCNKKIIGARWYGLDGSVNTARDTLGHGSHTASIVAGRNVKNASFYGFAQGTARGAVPSARIAIYRVCDILGCFTPDILAAFDDAIADGVDIISISIGGGYATEFYSDSISIGSFHAMEKGILTINCAGNDRSHGIPTPSVAPWVFTVAASTIDRRIVNKLVLDNATSLLGNAINTFSLSGKNFDIISGKDASSLCSIANARKCATGCLDKNLVKGKIVLCDDIDGLTEALSAGALGTIMPGGDMYDSFIVPLPAAGLSKLDMNYVQDYIKSKEVFDRNPKASISTSEVISDFDDPVVAEFSSLGPNTILPQILKPDITAPGVDILAAYSPKTSPSGYFVDKRYVKYSILSGTSMSCPHVAGAAAYVKSFHPHWSPSAIKSALMTSAWKMNATKSKFAEFAYGAGHIDPVKAVNPGLLFDTSKDDYVKLVCSMNYNKTNLVTIFGGNISCPKGIKMSAKDLNYPSMAFKVGKTESSFMVNFRRTVTHVGQANSTYRATVIRSKKLNITVKPDILLFKSVNEKKSFLVSVSGSAFKHKPFMESASLVWSDGPHKVRSPIVIYS